MLCHQCQKTVGKGKENTLTLKPVILHQKQQQQQQQQQHQQQRRREVHALTNCVHAPGDRRGGERSKDVVDAGKAGRERGGH
jgi:hypothetical protein